MFSESEVENLHKHKLWYDLCLYLQEHVETSTNDTVASYYKYALPNETNIHHYTFCRTTLVLSNLLQPEESQTLINNAAEAIQKNEYVSEEKQRTLLKLKIRHHENRIYLKQEEGTENFIYEVKNTKMDKETANLYFRMCYKYYEAKSDFEECHKYFEKYLSDVNMNEQAQEPARYDSQIMHKQYKSLYTSDNKALSYKLVKYTLLNPKTFNFTGVTLHKIYKFLDDESLKMLFENVMIGNVEYVLENKDTIEKILPSHYNLIKEKVYLMSFINLCFYNKERILTIDEIKQHLNVEREYVFYVLMKAFGMKLVKGVIDGEKDIVKYSYVIPRILNSDEIVVLRSKYENWADRIGTMIKLAK